MKLQHLLLCFGLFLLNACNQSTVVEPIAVLQFDEQLEIKVQPKFPISHLLIKKEERKGEEECFKLILYKDDVWGIDTLINSLPIGIYHLELHPLNPADSILNRRFKLLQKNQDLGFSFQVSDKTKDSRYLIETDFIGENMYLEESFGFFVFKEDKLVDGMSFKSYDFDGGKRLLVDLPKGNYKVKIGNEEHQIEVIDHLSSVEINSPKGNWGPQPRSTINKIKKDIHFLSHFDSKQNIDQLVDKLVLAKLDHNSFGKLLQFYIAEFNHSLEKLQLPSEGIKYNLNNKYSNLDPKEKWRLSLLDIHQSSIKHLDSIINIKHDAFCKEWLPTYQYLHLDFKEALFLLDNNWASEQIIFKIIQLAGDTTIGNPQLFVPLDLKTKNSYGSKLSIEQRRTAYFNQSKQTKILQLGTPALFNPKYSILDFEGLDIYAPIYQNGRKIAECIFYSKATAEFHLCTDEYEDRKDAIFNLALKELSNLNLF
jgi:hypothetical protein